MQAWRLSPPPRFSASSNATQADFAPSARRRTKPKAQVSPWGAPLSFASAGGPPSLGARLLLIPGPKGLAALLVASGGYEGALRQAGTGLGGALGVSLPPALSAGALAP